MSFEIRDIQKEDYKEIFEMLQDLVRHEGMTHLFKATEESLHRDLFSKNPRIFGVCVSNGSKLLGFALMNIIDNNICYHLGSALYIEEFYVRPEQRRKGLGKALLKFMAKLALNKGCSRMEFVVVRGNEIATQFYEKLGTWRLKHIEPYRLSKAELERIVI